MLRLFEIHKRRQYWLWRSEHQMIDQPSWVIKSTPRDVTLPVGVSHVSRVVFGIKNPIETHVDDSFQSILSSFLDTSARND